MGHCHARHPQDHHFAFGASASGPLVRHSVAAVSEGGVGHCLARHPQDHHSASGASVSDAGLGLTHRSHTFDCGGAEGGANLHLRPYFHLAAAAASGHGAELCPWRRVYFGLRDLTGGDYPQLAVWTSEAAWPAQEGRA